jgi:hypothetical protein
MLVEGFFEPQKRQKKKQKTQSKVILLGGRTTKDIKEKQKAQN